MSVGEYKMSDLEKTNLEAHVEICMMRNERLKEKLDAIDSKFNLIYEELAELEEKLDEDHKEILELMMTSNKEKLKALLAPAGTVLAALVTLAGYLIVNFGNLSK